MTERASANGGVVRRCTRPIRGAGVRAARLGIPLAEERALELEHAAEDGEGAPVIARGIGVLQILLESRELTPELYNLLGKFGGGHGARQCR